MKNKNYVINIKLAVIWLACGKIPLIPVSGVFRDLNTLLSKSARKKDVTDGAVTSKPLHGNT